MQKVSIRIWLTITGLLSALMVAVEPVFAAGNALSGYKQVVGNSVSQASIITTVKNVILLITVIGGAVAGAFAIFHFVKAGILMMGQGGARKEEGMSHLKWAFIGGAVALCAGLLAGVVAVIAGVLNGGSVTV